MSSQQRKQATGHEDGSRVRNGRTAVLPSNLIRNGRTAVLSSNLIRNGRTAALFVVRCDICPEQLIHTAVVSVDEALRNAVVVGR